MARLSTEINGDGSCAAVMPGESSTTTTNTTEDGGENSRDESANTTTNPSSVASSSVKSEAEEGGDQEIGQSVIRKNRYQKKQTSPHDAEDANDFENPPDPEAYEKLEFTAAAKEAMVSLLNAFMPELPEALEVPLEANTANLYFRLGSLAQFFNAMFAVPELLYIKDLPPMPSAPRHMNETRIANVHRYIRFWLTQFYACDDVIDTLRPETASHVHLTVMFTLQLLYTVRHALPQVHAIIVTHWSPALEGLGRQIEPLVRNEVLTSILAQQLERERVAHYEARKTSKKATQEAADLRAALEKARLATEKFRAMFEKANKHLQDVMARGGQSSSSGGLSILNNGSYETSILEGGGSLLNIPNGSFYSGQLPTRRGRGRPRKVQTQMTLSSASAALANLRPIKPRLAIGTNTIPTLLDGSQQQHYYQQSSIGVTSPPLPQLQTHQFLQPGTAYQVASTSSASFAGPTSPNSGGGNLVLVNPNARPTVLRPPQSQQMILQSPMSIQQSSANTFSTYSINGPILMQQNNNQQQPYHIRLNSPPPPNMISLHNPNLKLPSNLISNSDQSLLMKPGSHFVPISPPLALDQLQNATSGKSAVKTKIGRKRKLKAQTIRQAWGEVGYQFEPPYTIATPTQVDRYFSYIESSGQADKAGGSGETRCLLCRKTSANYEAFAEHYNQTHLNAKVFTCDWKGCERLFLSKHKLDRHRRCHTGERPFLCEKCGRRYPRMDKLKDHAKKCTGVPVVDSEAASTSTSVSPKATASKGVTGKRKAKQQGPAKSTAAPKKRRVVKKFTGKAKAVIIKPEELEEEAALPAEEAQLIEAELENVDIEEEEEAGEQLPVEELPVEEENNSPPEVDENSLADSQSQPDLVIAEDEEENEEKGDQEEEKMITAEEEGP